MNSGHLRMDQDKRKTIKKLAYVAPVLVLLGTSIEGASMNSSSPACDNKNPPWWCTDADDAPAAPTPPEPTQ